MNLHNKINNPGLMKSILNYHEVFMGFTALAGYYGNLVKGFNKIGIECHFINLEEPFKHNTTDNPLK